MTFSEQTIKILDYICEKFGIAIDWTSETIWPTIQTLAAKYISWEIASSIIWIIIWAIAMIICLLVIKWISRYVKDNEHGIWDDPQIAGVVFSYIFMVVFGVAACSQVFDIVKCIVFPELEIFEFLRATLNSMSK